MPLSLSLSLFIPLSLLYFSWQAVRVFLFFFILGTKPLGCDAWMGHWWVYPDWFGPLSAFGWVPKLPDVFNCKTLNFTVLNLAVFLAFHWSEHRLVWKQMFSVLYCALFNLELRLGPFHRPPPWQLTDPKVCTLPENLYDEIHGLYEKQHGRLEEVGCMKCGVARMSRHFWSHLLYLVDVVGFAVFRFENKFHFHTGSFLAYRQTSCFHVIRSSISSLHRIQWLYT